MKGTICIYYSRSGNTEEIAKYVNNKLNSELLCISDGINREGTKMYLKSGYESMKGILPKLKSFGMHKKLDDYRNVIICSPIWAWNICPVIRSFLSTYGKKIKGKTYFIVTHDSKSKYDKKINKLDEYLLNKHIAHLSICNRNKNNEEIDNFIKNIK